MNSPYNFGLALSGAATRSSFYIGFLEVLQENQLCPKVIAAQSGASIVALAYSCGRLEELKQDIFSPNSELLKRGTGHYGKKGAILSLQPLEEYLDQNYTGGQNFEELPIKLCFVATDLDTGTEVPLCTGSIARAARITCTVPGLYEPYQWGNKLLVDGGLASFIPSDHARLLGSDAVIGVNVRATKHIFLPHQLKLWRLWQCGRIPFTPAKSLSKKISELLHSHWLEGLHLTASNFSQERTMPNMFTVLGKSLDIAVSAAKRSRQLEKSNYNCDLLISESAGGFGDSFRFASMHQLYRQGRRAGEKSLPQIYDLLDQRLELPNSNYHIPSNI